MTRFRDLLKPEAQSTPAEEQQRASARLVDAVRQSHLWWKSERGPLDCPERCLLLAIAPYSQYDLVLLDLLDERIRAARPSVRVYVANLQDYDSPSRLGEDFPGAGQAPQSPLAALFESGTAPSVAWGKKARDLAGSVLGFATDELNRRVLEEAPGSSRSRALPGLTTPEQIADVEGLDEEQCRFLWQAYREEQAAGGPARDRLPFTEHFEHIRDRMNSRFNREFDSQTIWKSLSDLDKSPERRRRLGCSE